jgi:hypothetical protein
LFFSANLSGLKRYFFPFFMCVWRVFVFWLLDESFSLYNALVLYLWIVMWLCFFINLSLWFLSSFFGRTH